MGHKWTLIYLHYVFHRPLYVQRHPSTFQKTTAIATAKILPTTKKIKIKSYQPGDV
jgi:hypothetical protein